MESSRRPFCVFLVVALFAVDRHGRADETWPVTRGPSSEPRPYRYDPKQWQTVPKEFLEDATACVLYAGTTHLVEPDGTDECITHEITRLNGRKGIEKLGEYRQIAYDPAYQKVVLNVAVLHKADGRQLSVQPRHVQLRDVSTDYQVYNHEKQLIISFPNLEVGDTLEVKWTVRGKNPEHGGHFFTSYDFGDPGHPVVLDELRVRVPSGVPFHYACASGRIDPVITQEAGQRYYVWVARNCKQLPQDENLPSKEDMLPSVACSTFVSWDEIGRWEQSLRPDSWSSTPDIRKVVADVTKGLTDPVAKARALTFWLRRNIRYVSSGEHHDYTPHPPARVFANRFGDCKDTSQFLAVMMREAGLKVALVTLGTLDDGQIVESVPSLWGTHSILLVTLPDGEHWVDTTLSLGGWDYLPRDDRDRVCYLLDPEGHVTLRRTPPLTADANRYESTTQVSIGSDGTSRCERTVQSYGAAALSQRDSFVEVPAGERRRQVAAELQDGTYRARLLRVTFDESALRDFDRPVKSQMVFEIPGQFGSDFDRQGWISDSRTWTRLLAYNIDYDRQVPFELPGPFESRHRFVVHLPVGYALESLPKEQTVTSPWGRFEIQVKSPPGDTTLREVEVSFLTRIEKTRVELAQFAQYRRFQEEVTKIYRVGLALRPTFDPADIPVLEAVLALAPEDSTSAICLARIYSAQDKGAEALRVLRRARYYRPDETSLWELAVSCATNPEEEEASQRELVRRFPAERRYQLNLGELLLERGKVEAARAVLTSLAPSASPADRARAQFQLARSWERTGKPAEALKHLQAAEADAPEIASDVRAMMIRGRACESLGRLREAVVAYRQAAGLGVETGQLAAPPPPRLSLASRPTEREATDVTSGLASVKQEANVQKEAFNGLVHVALAQHDRTAALDYLRHYTINVEDDATGLLVAAEYYLQLGLCDEAVALATKAGGKHADPRVERILGLVHLQREEYPLALARLEKAGRDAVVLGGTLRAMLAVGVVAGLSDRLEQAKGIKDASAELRRTCADVLGVLDRRKQLERICPPPAGREAVWARTLDCLACAEYAHACGRPIGVVEQLLAGAFVGGEAPGPAFALRGRLALDSGKLARAVADASRAIALSPKDAGGYFVRGRVRLERGEAGAVEDLEKAAELTARRDADVLHGLADALFRAGKADQALTLQRQALQLKPHDREIAEQLTVFEKASRPAGAGG